MVEVLPLEERLHRLVRDGFEKITIGRGTSAVVCVAESNKNDKWG
jgi:hypothetical protein